MEAEASIQTPELVTLYRQAFDEFGTHALWYMKPSDTPTPDQALAVARALRIEGNLQARFLAERIEQVCRADH